MLDAIRDGNFKPDESRSGRFSGSASGDGGAVDSGKKDTAADPAPEYPETGSGSSSDPDEPVQQLDELVRQNAEEQRRAVKHLPEGKVYFQHASSAMVHVSGNPGEPNEILRCGRLVSSLYLRKDVVDEEWPQCSFCFHNEPFAR